MIDGSRFARRGGPGGLPAAVLLLAFAACAAFAQAGAPATPATAPRYTDIRGFVDWFQRGGIFMWPLLLCSVVGLAVVIERFVTISRSTRNTAGTVTRCLRALETGGPEAARRACTEDRSPAARIVYAGLSRIGQGTSQIERAIEAAGSIEVAFLQRGLLWLATVANLAPLLGFLGTVSGMIHAFSTIAAADQISARLVARGIEEALITTEAGLCIAIPIQALHNYFVGRIDRFATDVEESSLDLVATLDEIGAGPRNPVG